MNDLITRELDQGLLTLAFNRPDKLNALNTAMYQLLGDLLLAAGEDPLSMPSSSPVGRTASALATTFATSSTTRPATWTARCSA